MKLSRIILWILLTLMVLLVIIRVTMPLMLERAIVSWFDEQEITAKVEEISFNLGDGDFFLRGLKADKQGKPVLNLEKITVGWSWSDLFDSRARVRFFKVDGLAFDVDQNENGAMVVAGIDTAKLAEQSTEETSSNVEVDNQPVEWTVLLDELDLTNFNICYRQQSQLDYCTKFDRLNWQGDFRVDLAKLADTAIPLFASGDFEIDQFNVHNNTLSRDLINFTKLNLNSINIDTLHRVSIKQIQVQPLTLLNRKTDDLSPQVTRFESIDIANLELDELQRLSIGEIIVSDHEALLINTAEKQLEIDEWFPASEGQTTGDSNEQTDSNFQYTIAKLTYKTDKSIRYQDNSLAKPFTVNLNNIEISLENLDSNQPEQDSKIHYSAQYAEHGKISLDGTARPLLEKPSFDISGKISGLDLRDISPFTSEAIGHSIKSGQLDADLKLKADDAVLKSEVDLKLYHFELTALSPEDEEKINADFGFPLNSSLSLLKDSDNTIELNIPITGDLENPDFDTNDAITQATSSAITSAIISYYTPFGLVMAVEGLIDLATALDFEPVRFGPGDSRLNDKNRDELAKLVRLMNERPSIHLTLCSFSNTADRKTALPETAEIATDLLKLAPEQVNKLVQLSETRAAGVKQFLIEQKVEASRLVLCSPEHAEGKGLAGVEISI